MTSRRAETNARAADPGASGKHPHGSGYRPDIDGLRAVAVLSVVIFHAFPGLLRGGFVGVDIFFVISGFLISGILVGNLRRGRFSFAEFLRGLVFRRLSHFNDLFLSF